MAFKLPALHYLPDVRTPSTRNAGSHLCVGFYPHWRFGVWRVENRVRAIRGLAAVAAAVTSAVVAVAAAVTATVVDGVSGVKVASAVTAAVVAVAVAADPQKKSTNFQVNANPN